MYRFGFLLFGSLSLLAGCQNVDQTQRLQSEEESDKSHVQTVGDVSEFQTSGSVPISGVGLVVGLEGTGGGTPPGEYRNMMEQYLKKCQIDNPKAWLDSPNNALVLVNGEIPSGSRRGERIHVEITLPPGSKARSLRGGYLLETPMISYASQGQVRNFLEHNTDVKPVTMGDHFLKGHTLAEAEGPLQVILKDRENIRQETDRVNRDRRGRSASEVSEVEGAVKRAWVWKGAKTKADQPLFVVMNPDQQRYRKAEVVAFRINETFHGPGALEKVAVQRGPDSIVIFVPPQYRTNLAHFLRVVRMIPEQRAEENGEYLRKLEEQLKQPETALSAALRLEALGRTSIPILRTAMQKSEYPLVRFAAAEALAYLGEPIAANELAKLTELHPSLQALCLTALGSLDEAASSYALKDLLVCSDPEVRYGAFRALREIDRGSDAVRSFWMNKSFWMHIAGSDSLPMVHLLSSTRSEVVLFGKTPELVAPFSLRAGPDIIITAKRADQKCTISRFSTRKGEKHEQCSFAVADIIKTMADLGAQYQDVAELLMEARDTKCMNCDLAMDAFPKSVPVQLLADHARMDKNLEKEEELMKAAVPDSPGKSNVFDRAAARGQ